MRNAARRDWSARLGARRGLFSGVRWDRYPFGLMVLAAALLCVGVVLIHSMSLVGERYSQADEIRFGGHLQKLVVAAPMLLIGGLVRPSFLRKQAYTIYVGSILFLALVPFIGIELNNAKRWIPTPVGFLLQPSEFAKLGLIIVLARVLHRRHLHSVSEWVRPALLAALPMVMVAAQPDLGTALTVVPITVGMLYLAGGDGRWIVGLGLAGATLALCAWQFEWVQDYQLRRIDTWAASFEAEDLIRERNGPAFHVYHARVSIGNGGLWGTGLGAGVASRAAHLPERESDSIFCVAAEEFGFSGAVVLLGAYLGLVVGLLGLGAGLRERFSRFVVQGVALYFAAHLFINTGVNLGLVPMTGLTLPLLSTGGSSLMTTFGALGLAFGLAARVEPSLDEDAFRS
ncbi:MAG: FtsW/RodA/SpoVE family cell cycle protein [Planctomycetota bacterium]